MFKLCMLDVSYRNPKERFLGYIIQVMFENAVSKYWASKNPVPILSQPFAFQQIQTDTYLPSQDH